MVTFSYFYMTEVKPVNPHNLAIIGKILALNDQQHRLQKQQLTATF
jgi:hypothetical protein